MFELVLVVVFGILAYRGTTLKEDEFSVIPKKISDKMGQLWDIAHQGMR
jgi:hypothetical protein